MKKIIKVIVSLVLIAVLASTAQFPGSVSEPGVVYANNKSEPKTTVSKVTLYINYKIYQIKFENLKKNASFTCKSSNTKVAKVSNAGTITPISKGTATVTVTIKQNSKQYISKIKVTVTYPNIKFTAKESNLQVGDIFTFESVAYGTENKTVWSVSDKSLAKIDSDTGKLTAISPGEVDVIATAGNLSCNITVLISEKEFTTDSKEVTCYDEKIIYITTHNMNEAESIVYDIEDINIVTCEWGDWEGDKIPLLIIPESVGKTTITIRSSLTTSKIVITVNVIEEPKGRDQNSKVLTAKEIYAKCAPATAELQITKADGEYVGSGFFIYSGILITNYHVIEGATKIQVLMCNENIYAVDSILGYDKNLDIAVLSIDAVTEHLTLNKGRIAVGDVIYALGSPRGLTGSLSNGIVSSVSRMIDNVDYIQITAPISGGNSGGPLLNEYGEVIGINTFMLVDSQNLNFAINVFQYQNLNFDSPIAAKDFYSNNQEEAESLREDSMKSYSILTSQYININTILTGALDVSNNADYYHFTIKEATDVTILLVCDLTDIDYVNCRIIDGYSNVISESKKVVIDDDTYRKIEVKLSPGEYYILVYPSEGNNSKARGYAFYLY